MRRLLIITMLLGIVAGGVQAADTKASAPVPGQKFVVFFEEWSARLDDAAQAVIARAAAAVKAAPGSIAHVAGFADPTGSRVANVLLSDLRAQVVVDQLQTDGLAPKQVSQRGHGPVKFALTSQESRRVEISVTPH